MRTPTLALLLVAAATACQTNDDCSAANSFCLGGACHPGFSGKPAAAPKPLIHSAYTFADYKNDFRKAYADEAEHALRHDLFRTRLSAALAHNANPAHSWRRGVNHLSDRTEAELATLRGLDKPLLHHQRRQDDASGAHAPPAAWDAVALEDLPDHVDWRDCDVVTAVKNQGSCGSCWTFASAEALESHWAIKTGNLECLSEQFILDCTPNPKQCGGGGGCTGGTAQLAYASLHGHGGIPSEWTQPYTSGGGQAGKCHGVDGAGALQPSLVAANVTGYVSLPTNDYASLLKAVALAGPVAVSVDASEWSSYESGVFTGGNHTNPDIDHLVLLVGYGTDPKEGDYWLIRNSWKPTWGERGYIRIKRSGPDAACGMDITPLHGSGCKGGPPVVKVCGQNGILYDNAYPLV